MEKRTLLKKYDIPISHLDFGYIEKCKDAKEMERIVAILRSGEEGHYPDLTKCAEVKLNELKPNSRVLRTEERILTKHSLSTEKWDEHCDHVLEWSKDVKNKDSILSNIVESPQRNEGMELPPIRKCGKVTSMKKNTVKPCGGSEASSQPNRPTAATDYNQWDKYDAEAEVLKIDLEEERVKEHVERMNRINQDRSAAEKAINLEEKSHIIDKLTQIEREKLAEDYKIIGNECFKTKEFQSALEHYSRSIQMQPTAAGFNNRAITHLKLMKYADALSDCDECLRLEPNNLKALLRRAEACLSLSRNLDAYQTYEMVKSIDPDNLIASKALGKLRAELGEVAPLHATRIKICENDENHSNAITPVKDYDLADLVKPNKLVKSNLAKTMESIGKLAPPNKKRDNSKLTDMAKRSQLQNNNSDIRLSIDEPISRVRGKTSCLIQEL